MEHMKECPLIYYPDEVSSEYIDKKWGKIIQTLSIAQKQLGAPIGKSKVPGRIRKDGPAAEEELYIYDKAIIYIACRSIDDAMQYITELYLKLNEENKHEPEN